MKNLVVKKNVWKLWKSILASSALHESSLSISFSSFIVPYKRSHANNNLFSGPSSSKEPQTEQKAKNDETKGEQRKKNRSEEKHKKFF